MSSFHARSTNESAEVRGFAFFVGIDEFRALADGTTLSEMAAELKQLVERLAPSAQTFTSIAVAPAGSGGSDLDVVKRSSQIPPLQAERAVSDDSEPVIIDLSRRRMIIGTEVRLLTFMEFELLEYLVEHEGTAVSRRDLVEVMWSSDTAAQVSTRTIDVHVRRLRVKLGSAADLVRTVHGVGYVFNRASNVHVRFREQWD